MSFPELAEAQARWFMEKLELRLNAAEKGTDRDFANEAIRAMAMELRQLIDWHDLSSAEYEAKYPMVEGSIGAIDRFHILLSHPAVKAAEEQFNPEVKE